MSGYSCPCAFGHRWYFRVFRRYLRQCGYCRRWWARTLAGKWVQL